MFDVAGITVLGRALRADRPPHLQELHSGKNTPHKTLDVSRIQRRDCLYPSVLVMGGNISKAKEEREDVKERFRPPKPVVEDDYSKPLPPKEKLPPALQKIVDNEETLWDSVVEGQ
jgi:hypothetical protein